jgi:hypothetical protein
MKRALAITMTLALLGSLMFMGFAGTAAATVDDKNDKHADDKNDKNDKHADDKNDKNDKHADDKNDKNDKHADDKPHDRYGDTVNQYADATTYQNQHVSQENVNLQGGNVAYGDYATAENNNWQSNFNDQTAFTSASNFAAA